MKSKSDGKNVFDLQFILWKQGECTYSIDCNVIQQHTILISFLTHRN